MEVFALQGYSLARIACLIGFPLALFGQVNGGDEVFEFMNFSPSARITALGGNMLPVFDDDINLARLNPALLNPSMHQQLAFNHNFHINSLNNGYAAFGHHVEAWQTTFQVGAQYAGYGEFEETDEAGQVLGTFRANEYALNLGAGRQVDERLHIGANLRLVSSQLAAYHSFGLAADLAVAYQDTGSAFVATLVARNIGAQLSTYDPDSPHEPLPFEVQVGISKRLRYLPFRLSIVYRYLDQWNITYDDPNTAEPDFLFDTPDERSDFAVFTDNLFRHFVFGGEFLFGKLDNFRLRIGYNHLLRKELSVQNYGSLAGFSFGAGVKIKQFRLAYGHQVYHIAGGVNHISISTNLGEFR